MLRAPDPEPHDERFTEAAQLGNLGYRYLGEWSQRAGNRPIERGLLEANLGKRGCSGAPISAALQKLETAADATGITLYQANLRTYRLLRYFCFGKYHNSQRISSGGSSQGACLV